MKKKITVYGFLLVFIIFVEFIQVYVESMLIYYQSFVNFLKEALLTMILYGTKLDFRILWKSVLACVLFALLFILRTKVMFNNGPLA